MQEGKWANPGPAGLMVLGFYLGCLWPVATGQAPRELIVVLVPLGLAGALVQMAAGIIELKNGETLPGNIMLAFSAFMWLGAGEKLLQAVHLLPENTAAVDGWIFLIMGILMVGFTPGFFLANTAASLFMIFTDVFFCSAGLSWLLGSRELWFIAGWDLPLVVITIIWQALGAVLNSTYRGALIPMGPPWVRLKRGEASPAVQPAH